LYKVWINDKGLEKWGKYYPGTACQENSYGKYYEGKNKNPFINYLISPFSFLDQSILSY